LYPGDRQLRRDSVDRNVIYAATLFLDRMQDVHQTRWIAAHLVAGLFNDAIRALHDEFSFGQISPQDSHPTARVALFRAPPAIYHFAPKPSSPFGGMRRTGSRLPFKTNGPQMGNEPQNVEQGISDDEVVFKLIL
jgi:hypothetical protein